MPKSESETCPPDPDQASRSGYGDLGSPVLLDGENRAEYEQLLARVTADVEPRDILEEFGVKDIVDLVWEAWRLRRLKANLLKLSARHGLKEVLEPLVREVDPKDPVSTILNAHSAGALVQNWYAKDPNALKQVDALLRAADLTMEQVNAQTLAIKLDDIERIDRMIALAEARRNAALREMDRHRKALAEQLRRATDIVEDAEFAAIPTQTGAPRPGHG
jgi:hypothetical protein